MDTAWNDHNITAASEDITHLQAVEAAWHQKQLVAADGRNIILMSHHQLFSSFATIGPGGSSFENPHLIQNLQDWRAAGASHLLAWLWGHEHLLEVYAAPASGGGLPILGRCVGNGAFPVFNNTGAYTKNPDSPIPLQPAQDFPNGYVQTAADGLVYASGFAVLTLGPVRGKADYYQVLFDGDVSAATSQLLWTDTLATAGDATHP
jgi:hypothetical protein